MTMMKTLSCFLLLALAVPSQAWIPSSQRILKPATFLKASAGFGSSDGLDTDAPERLQDELEALRARVRSIVWLNPMLGREGVTLTTESLRQTLPAVDGFYPANSLDSLQRAIARIAGQAG